MQRTPGCCGVCGKGLNVKAIAAKVGGTVGGFLGVRQYCPDEGDAAHAEAAERGWDAYDPEDPPRA